MAFKVPYMLLADAVHEMQRNKIQVVGLFDQIFPRELPAVYGSFTIVALVVAEGEDDLGPHQVAFRIVGPNDQQIAEIGGDARFELRGGAWPLASLRFVVQVAQIPFHSWGRHRIQLLVDGRPVAEHPLLVSAPPAGQQ